MFILTYDDNMHCLNRSFVHPWWQRGFAMGILLWSSRKVPLVFVETRLYLRSKNVVSAEFLKGSETVNDAYIITIVIIILSRLINLYGIHVNLWSDVKPVYAGNRRHRATWPEWRSFDLLYYINKINNKCDRFSFHFYPTTTTAAGTYIRTHAHALGVSHSSKNAHIAAYTQYIPLQIEVYNAERAERDDSKSLIYYNTLFLSLLTRSHTYPSLAASAAAPSQEDAGIMKITSPIDWKRRPVVVGESSARATRQSDSTCIMPYNNKS